MIALPSQRAWIAIGVLTLVLVNIALWLPNLSAMQTSQSSLLEETITRDVVRDSQEQDVAALLFGGDAAARNPNNISSTGTDAPTTPQPAAQAPLWVGGFRVRPLGTIFMDGRTGAFPDYQPPGVHQIRRVDHAYGVHRIPWALQKATTALAEWFHCVRTTQYFNGLVHPDGSMVTPCPGQLMELASIPPPQFEPCVPGSGALCSEQGIHIPPQECGYSYLGCIRDSVADQRWNDWFQKTFLPKFAQLSSRYLRIGEGVAESDVVGRGFHIVSTCLHVLLGPAPWCGLRTSEFNDWMLNLKTGIPAERNNTELAMNEPKRRLYVAASLAAKEPLLPSSLQPQSEARAAETAQLGAEVLASAFKDPLISRKELLQMVKEHFLSVSKSGQLNAEDAKAVEKLKWRPWPAGRGGPLPDFTPVIPAAAVGWVNEDEVSANHTADAGSPSAASGRPTDAPGDVFSVEDFPEEDLESSPAFGSVYLQRVRSRYPVLLAIRRDDPTIQDGRRPTRDRMLDRNGRVIGFHVCIFGALRNFSSTVRQIQRRYLDTMKPQRIHIVTNDAGLREYYDGLPASMSPNERKAAARATLFSAYTSIVPFAATMLAVPTGLTRKNECLHCRGAFMKELGRMVLLSDLARNYPLELVFMFRPDSYPLIPLQLTPFFPDDGKKHIQGSLMGYHPHARRAPSSLQDASHDADFIQYRLNASDYQYTLVRDRGFVPTVFGYISDMNVTKYSAVFHTRVSLGLDFGWTGDPILFGHWNVINHWLQHFSTTMGSVTDLWEEKQPGEKHQYRFFARYMAPLFKLGVEAGVLTHALDMRIFDFMFSLYRQSAAINRNLFALHVSYAAYQEMTIMRDYPTKYQEAQCKHYKFIPVNVNLTQEYTKNAQLSWNGMIGRVSLSPLPMDACRRAPTPPGLPTCYPPFVRVPLSSRNAFKAPCAPFCGHSNLLALEGMCIYTGKQGKHPRTFGKPNMATYSESPMSRSIVEGEVQRFNVVFPQSVRRRIPRDVE